MFGSRRDITPPQERGVTFEICSAKYFQELQKLDEPHAGFHRTVA